MNQSVVSEYENVPNVEHNLQSESVIYETLNNILESANSFALQYYCPFCVQHFQFKFTLMEHLKTYHQTFLNIAMNEKLQFYKCPFCYAKFYGSHLTGKHALENHTTVIGEIYLECKGKARGMRLCIFCKKTLNCTSTKHLAKHIEKEHLLEFYELFNEQFVLSGSATGETSQADSVQATKSFTSCNAELFKDIIPLSDRTNEKDFPDSSITNCFDLVDLKQQIINIKSERVLTALNTNESLPKKSILKTPGNPSSVKRVLRFDLSAKENHGIERRSKPVGDIHKFPESGLMFHEDVLETDFGKMTFLPIGSSTPNTRWLTMEKSNMVSPLWKRNCKKHKTKSVNSTKESGFVTFAAEGNYFAYKCGKCLQLFSNNEELVTHVKSSHKQFTVNLLQPFYECAICGLKFFKNNYLKKHINLHSLQSLQKCFC